MKSSLVVTFSFVALLGSVSAQASKPGPKPKRAGQTAAKESDLRRKAIAFERELNLSVYKKKYRPDREGLFARHGGKWIVIASGKMFPVRKESTGVFNSWVIAPAPTLEAAIAAANKMVPDAKHRFVFRIGEEGDHRYELGMSTRRNNLGGGFMTMLPGDAMVTGKEIVTMRGKKRLSLKLERGFLLKSVVTRPGDKSGSASVGFQVSTVLTGIGTVSAELADRLSLALWEIPGAVTLGGSLQKGSLRRARIRLSFPAVDYALTVPIAVWQR